MHQSRHLVVVEVGASWTRWLEAREPVKRPMVAVLQEHDEDAPDFAARVSLRFEHLARIGPPIERFTLVGGEDSNIPRLRARLAIVRSARDCGLLDGVAEIDLEAVAPPHRNDGSDVAVRCEAPTE